MVDLKWFESWKMYIFNQYNIHIEVYKSVLETINTVRTCKKVSVRTSKSLKLSRKKTQLDTSKDLHGCRYLKLPNRDTSK